MLIIPLLSVLEEAVHGDDGSHKLSGNVTDLDRLLARDSLEALEQAHEGYFAFLAFQPSVDAPVRSYITEGSLPADSGIHSLVLFTFAESQATQWVYNDESLSTVTVEENSDLPAQTALRYLFGNESPPMPGIAVFASFSHEADVLYFYLDQAGTAAEVRSQLRTIFSIANAEWQRCEGRRDKFADALALACQRRKLRFERTGHRSMLQWLDLIVHWLDRHSGDIVAVAGLGIP